MAAEGGSSAYIQHHLQNLQACRVDGEWVTNIGQAKICSGNIWAVNVDSMFFTIVLGVIFCALFRRVAVNIEQGKPGKLQAMVEMIVEKLET